MFNPKNILVTTDFTDESGKALRETLDIADKYQSTVHLLHVIEDIQQCAVDYCLSESEILAEKNKLLEEGMKKMDAEINLIARGRAVPILKEIRFGHTVDEIIKYEGEKKIDLVVTAPHKSQKRWWRIAPHLTNSLVRKSLCETMVIK
jgi:universal stress protein A